MPQSIGDCTPAGGGTWAATVRKSSPMKPSGVQLASAIVPPGRQTRSSSAAACSWSGANIEPKTDVTASKEASGNGSASASPSSSSTVEALGGGAPAAALEQGRHVVDADRRAAVPRGRDRGVAAAGGDVEHAPAGVQVGGVAELLGDEHDPGGDDGEVAARPGLLLALLDGGEVGLGGFQHVSQGVSSVSIARSSVRGDRRYGGAAARSSGTATHLSCPPVPISGLGFSRLRHKRGVGRDTFPDWCAYEFQVS